jgi:hypothetical protein
MAGIKIVDLPAVGRDLAATDLFEMSLAGGTGSRKITGQEIMNASKLSVNNTPVINGTAGRIFFQGSTNVLQQSGNLFWDDVNGRLGVGTSNPQARYHQSQTQGILARYDVTNANADQNRGVWEFYTNTAATPDFFGRFGFKFEGGINNAARQFQLHVADNTTPRFVVNGSGNVLINTTTDAGFRLDVNGTARVQGALSLTAGNVFNIGNVQVLAPNTGNDIMVGFNNSLLTFYTSNNIVGRFFSTGNFAIGTSTDNSFKLDVNGTARVQSKLTIGNSTASPYQLNVWGGATESYISLNNTNSGALNTDGFQIGLEANGTDVYFINRENGFIQFRTNGLDRFRVANTGNVLINTTTDAGFRLDVNGTARVSGQVDIVGLSSLQISAVQQSNSRVIQFNTNASSGGFNGGYDFRGGFNGSYGSSSVFRIYTASSGTSRVGIGNLTEPNMQSASAQLIIRSEITGGRNAGIRITPSTAATTQYNGIQFDYNTLDSGGGAFLGTQYNPLTNGYGVDLVVLTTNDTINNYSETARFIGKFNSFYVGTDKTLALASAKMQVESTTQGFLPPRMTQTQRNAIASPAIGLEIYQTDATEGKYIYKSSGWTYIG